MRKIEDENVRMIPLSTKQLGKVLDQLIRFFSEKN